MKKILLLLAMCFVQLVNAQVDVFDGGVLSVGFGSRSGSFSGILYRHPLSLTQGSWDTEPADLTPFHFKGLASDIKLVTFDEKGVLSLNADGMLYLLSGFPYAKDMLQFRLNKWVATPITEIYGKGNWDSYRTLLWNWRIIESNAIFGKRAIGGGFHISARSIGLPNFTYYQMPGENNWVIQQGAAMTLKMLGGVILGYRQNFGKLAVFFIGGVNSCLNHDNATAIKWNPFFKPTIYFGGKRGITLSAYYEKYTGTVYQNSAYKTYPVPLKLTNLEICLGLYVGGKGKEK